MKTSIAKKTDADGWKAVKAGDDTIGHIIKLGDHWRARMGRTEHLGFATQKDAVAKLVELAG